ncbi:MAG: phosphoribosylglycinamide formyltransferase [Paludibacter sp.]|nr:phosphoribosylglycinamide formyltransferase [Paludibacter sp.]
MSSRIAILASGSGSNAENIVNYFSKSTKFTFSVILSNKKDAFVHERAKKLSIPSYTFTKEEFSAGDVVLNFLKENNIDYIVLAGFLLKIPTTLIKAYPNKIINIHPALLPKYGGKGMYGNKVHEAVKNAGENESGITIHYVNENYDEGNIIFQAKCSLTPTDSAADIATKVHALEYEHYPKVIDIIWG